MLSIFEEIKLSKITIIEEEIDQPTAQRLFREGAVFIFLDVPEGTEFGIDLKSWNTGDKFRGVKMIPPGVHYIFYSSVNQDYGQDVVAPRAGFFYNFRGTEVVVRKWDKRTESISMEPVPEEQVVGLKENIKALDQFLGPYPYSIYQKWISMTSNITDNLLNRLGPVCGEIRSAVELQGVSDADRPRGSKSTTPCKQQIEDTESLANNAKRQKRTPRKSMEDFLPTLKPVEGTQMRLTPFPDQNYPDGCSPSDITRHSLDSTYVLETMLSKYASEKELLGEMEYCFVSFLVGHCLDGFEQWKKIVSLFCSCDAAIEKHRSLFVNFLTVLETHIDEIPGEFLADIVSNKNFVYVKLKQLFRTIQEYGTDDQLKSRVQRVKQNLFDKHGWDFDYKIPKVNRRGEEGESEDDDEAPVVVDISQKYY